MQPRARTLLMGSCCGQLSGSQAYSKKTYLKICSYLQIPFNLLSASRRL